jgi:hypothetical protein
VKEMSRPRLVDGGKSVRFISCFVGWVGEEEEAIYSGLASLLLMAKMRFRGWEYLPAWEVMVMDGCPVVARKVFETASFGELVVASACPSRRTAHRYLYLAYPAPGPFPFLSPRQTPFSGPHCAHYRKRCNSVVQTDNFSS